MEGKIAYNIRDNMAAILKDRELEELSVCIAFRGTLPDHVKTYPVGPKNRELHINHLIVQIISSKNLLKMAFVHPFFIFHLPLFLSEGIIGRSLVKLFEET